MLVKKPERHMTELGGAGLHPRSTASSQGQEARPQPHAEPLHSGPGAPWLCSKTGMLGEALSELHSMLASPQQDPRVRLLRQTALSCSRSRGQEPAGRGPTLGPLRDYRCEFFTQQT